LNDRDVGSLDLVPLIVPAADRRGVRTISRDNRRTPGPSVRGGPGA
jgi:hypothetical protein